VSDGTQNNPNLMFAAKPSNIEMILRYLKYESIMVLNDSNVPDNTIDRNIYIRISDGIGNDSDTDNDTTSCWTEWEQYQFKNSNIMPTPILMDHPVETTATLTPLLARKESCYQTMAILTIPSDSSIANHLWNRSDTDIGWIPNDRFFDFVNIADVLFWSLICTIIAGSTCIYRKLPHCTARGKAIDVESTEENTRECRNNADQYQFRPNDWPNWDDHEDHFSISTVNMK
jgi:hypothetical protein